MSLGAPPRDPSQSLYEQDVTGRQNLPTQQSASVAEVNGFSVSPSVRSSVVAFHENVYTPVFSVPMNWTGNTASCAAGNTSQAYIDASFNLINYYRAMVELPPVVNDTSKNAASQEAALMMSVNNSLSHSPPPSWQCYTSAGDTAAGSSNLALGAAGPARLICISRIRVRAIPPLGTGAGYFTHHDQALGSVLLAAPRVTPTHYGYLELPLRVLQPTSSPGRPGGLFRIGWYTHAGPFRLIARPVRITVRQP